MRAHLQQTADRDAMRGLISDGVRFNEHGFEDGTGLRRDPENDDPPGRPQRGRPELPDGATATSSMMTRLSKAKTAS
jgi:hypothetical protein